MPVDPHVCTHPFFCALIGACTKEIVEKRIKDSKR